MPRGRNAKEARREKRQKPRYNGPTHSTALSTRMPHYDDSDDSEGEMDLRDLMTFALMAKVMQQGLCIDSDDSDDGSSGPFGAGCPFSGLGGLMALAGGINSSRGNVGHSGDHPKILGFPEPDMDYIEAIGRKLKIKNKFKRKECERRAKIEDVKSWEVKPRAWDPSDKNNILMIQLKKTSKLDLPNLNPEKITEIVMYNDVFHRSSESPRFNLNKKLFAVYIDKPTDMHELLKLETLSLDVQKSESNGEDSSESDLDDSLLEDEIVAVHCFRPQAKTKDERWWEDNTKYVVINQHKPLTFYNDQLFEESHLHSIVSWSRALKIDDEFFLGLCQRCLNFAAPSQKMVVCNACHLVAYCNKNCLKKDRNRHKKLCSAYSVNHCNMNVFERALLEVRSVSSPEKRKELFFIFLCHIDSNPEVLKAKPLGEEKLDYITDVIRGLEKPFFNDCLQYPRICNVCFTSDKDKLKECECYCVAYCSEQHRVSDLKHKLVCKDLLKIARVYAFCKKKSLDEQNLFSPLYLGNLLQGVDVTSKSLDSMDDLVNSCHFPSGSQPDEWLDVKLALLSQRLAMPLTILHLLEKGGLGPDKKSVNAVEKLTIHILCEQPFLDPSSWEFFLHRLPRLKKLNLHFCQNNGTPGGSVNHLNTSMQLQRCRNCEESGRLITFTLYPGIYQHLLNKDELDKPDIVYVINPKDLIEPNDDDSEVGDSDLDDSDWDDFDEDDSDEDDSSDEKITVNQELFYKNITKYETSGLIIANESKKKMLISYRGLCKVRSIQLMKINGFTYDRKNPFSGFSSVRQKYENKNHEDVVSNNQSYVAYLTRTAKENSEEKVIEGSNIWKVEDDRNHHKSKSGKPAKRNGFNPVESLGDTSDESDLPDLIDD